MAKISPPLTVTVVEAEEPLPLTLGFVLVFGVAIVAGWFAMFALLQSRW